LSYFDELFEQEKRMTASSLKRPTIGVLPGWEVYENANLVNYLGPLLFGIRAAARERQCNLLVACGMGFPGGQLGGIQPAWPEAASDTYFIPVGPFNTDGLIVINPLVSEARIAYVRRLIQSGVKVVFVGTALGGPAVAVDNRGGIRLAVKHLVQHGHQRIAFIAGSPNDLHGDSEERLQAYRSSLQEFGLDVDPASIAYGLHIVEGGRMAMQEILDAKVPFTAVLGSSDECAIGAMQVLKEQGYRIPEDVAVIGFDDETEAVVQDPPLTSVHSPTFERGYHALELALDYVEGRRQAAHVVNVPARLMVRQSCGCMMLESRQTAIPQPTDAATDGPETRSLLELSRSMAEAVLSCSHFLSARQVLAFCRELVETYHRGLQNKDMQEFYRALRRDLRQAEAEGDDAYAWQLGILTLRENLSALLNTDELVRRDWAERILAGANLLIMDAMQQQHKRFLLDQKRTTDRMASLTSRLFDTLDGKQVFNVLTEWLPEIGIPHAAIVFYDSEGADPFSRGSVRTIPGAWDASIRIDTRDFPPISICPLDHPYSLALIPLGIQGKLSGFVAFDTARLELYGAIVQQLEHALKQHGFIGNSHAKTILILDEEPGILEIQAHILQKAGSAWRVLKVQEGREALSLIRQEKPDLVLLDPFVAEMDGFGVLETMLREKSLSNIPVIVLTGQNLNSEQMQRLNRGVSAVLRKGIYNIDEMITRMAGVLERSVRPGTETQRLARKAMAYIHEHYSDTITRDQIADHLGISEDHLTRCFHEETGLTPMTYLRRYRLDQAKDLLAAGEKTVTEVALAVGFSDSNYFSRAFRQVTGTSPSAYRRS
jgi:DNA-binding LacI/PurR family transcriptional regulator/AraC-like DNA-binding protein